MVQLLQVVQGYDNRTVDGATVSVWSKAAQIGRWSYDAAVEAVHQHYASSTDWLMPAHITRRVRDAARQPAPASEVLQIGGPPPASEETRAWAKKQVEKQIEKLAKQKDIKQWL